MPPIPWLDGPKPWGQVLNCDFLGSCAGAEPEETACSRVRQEGTTQDLTPSGRNRRTTRSATSRAARELW